MAQSIYSALRAEMQNYFNRGLTLPIAARKAALLRLKSALQNNEKAFYNAVKKDFGRCAFDSWSCEFYMIQEELALAIRSLAEWSAMRPVDVGIINAPAQAIIRPEPLGTVLIFSPWNYPALLALAPLIGAVGAGNCAVLKPSSSTPHTSALLQRVVRAAFDPRHVTVLVGDHAISDVLLNERFDLIFFTGSPVVGRHVMQAAAANLTPVILELGGKSPCIIDETATLPQAARRIAWGKFLNAGQTCVAPDYLLVQKSVAPRLVSELKHSIKKLYYPGGKLTAEWPCIITPQHTERLASLLKNERIAFGGGFDIAKRLFEPTLLFPVSPKAPCMQQELFGPVLPILVYDSLEEVIGLIRKGAKPLALYHFSTDKKAIARVLSQTSAGGGCVNDVIMHVSSPRLPFGGVGMSGMGRYHGRASFDAFSNPRSVLIKSPGFELPLR
ncbi:MAG TPA: aldehyde dehydrogenase family protein, partial [Clostridia bacterium]|nr:aldehyde dehydrogenase family protein [Clostridia bacterium]